MISEKSRYSLKTSQGTFTYYALKGLGKDFSKLPFTIKILLENVLRHVGKTATTEHVQALAGWKPNQSSAKEIPFMPGRVLLQDLTGVPFTCDLAMLRDVMKKMGNDPRKINPLIPVDLVIDHSVQVDQYRSPDAYGKNVEREYQRNGERYRLLKWAQKSFQNFRVVPPGTGICHQVNLEYLAKVVQTKNSVAYPDTLVGADSHTTMINGLGVLGWGVGGIEAEACMLGQPIFVLVPEVIGFKLHGKLPEGATATDLVLKITQMLRQKNVVGKFVEFFGTGLSNLSLPDRATVANMSPEFGATCGFFPVDEETLRYLRNTNRDPDLVNLVADYTKAQGLFRTDDLRDPNYSDHLELDLKDVTPAVAGPKLPEERVPISELKTSVQSILNNTSLPSIKIKVDGSETSISNASVVIAAITSCTNTSNPSVMLGAGILAKKAVEAGLKTNPAVKTSLAPGSPVVIDYLKSAGLLPYLEKLGFNLVGYGCTTCIGNSGPLPEPVAEAIKSRDLWVTAVLSGNRNFGGRIHPLVNGSYLASPPLVVAYALAGRVDIDLTSEPIGQANGRPIFLRDIWPKPEEIQSAIEQTVKPEFFKARYGKIFDGDAHWAHLDATGSDLFAWDPKSTYAKQPPFFEKFNLTPDPIRNIEGARIFAVFGDSITTDHISPAGSIDAKSPAGQYLLTHGVDPLDFNSYGARRGNHEVMIRGTFANPKIKNQMVSKDGPITVHVPSGETLPFFSAAMLYKKEKTPLVVIAGKNYGAGSSRDWAAKGPELLGVRAVIAESFERIHRSNLIGMGVLPIQFKPGDNRMTLNLTGTEILEILGIENGLSPGKRLTINVTRSDGSQSSFEGIARLDGAIELEYYRNGGILQTVIRQILAHA